MEPFIFNPSSLLLPFFLFGLLQTSTIAAKKSYIVYLGSHSHGSNPSQVDTQIATQSHYNLLGSLLGSNEAAKEAILYSYNRYINGFAAVLDLNVAQRLSKHPNVVSIYENKLRKLHTTSSWRFLGLENDGGIVPSNSLWKAASFGESTIIANLDTGVWPESKSFNDEGYGPIPTRWKGSCEGGTNFHCNRKLIGARYFNKGYAAVVGPLDPSMESARDSEGHGTHTLSTAGGNFVAGASVFGNGNGTAKGGSPKALVAAYKVCWPQTLSFTGGCYDADILAAIEAAITDGVDVLSLSLGADPIDFAQDVIAIGTFHAVQHGITVVCSAGNSGPTIGSVSNVAPWIITVGASTIDRLFTSYVTLGNKKYIKGTSLSDKALPVQKWYPLINPVDAKANNYVLDSYAQLCREDSIDPKKVKGKIVVCLRERDSRVDKGYVVAKAGGVGMILANDKEYGDQTVADLHFLPTSHVTYDDGQLIYQYINSTKNPMAVMTPVKTELGVKPAPFMAAFSSRGPNIIEASLLKPDITAPGVNILAAYAEDIPPTGSKFDKRRIPFNVVSGTSMSCPHVAGIVGLLKTLYPKWSHAAIRSAIMTTAETKANDLNPILSTSQVKAGPFEYGAGHVNPNRAADPGLVYDLSTDDYLNFLCARGYTAIQMKQFSNTTFVCSQSLKVIDLNYPSISIPELQLGAVVKVNRRVKNVGSKGSYVADIKAPPGVSVTVEPSSLQFTTVGEEKSFSVVFKRVADDQQGYVFGQLVWSDGKHNVRSPIVVQLG